MTIDLRIEDLLRSLAPDVLGVLVHRHGRFDACEDAVQEALLAAAMQWPAAGTPGNPRGWLLTVATRRLTDELRAEGARHRRETGIAATSPPEGAIVRAPDDDDAPGERDDSLLLLFLCCHPSLSPASQVALTLRAVGGLTTAEIGRAYLIPEATMAQRISRAKATIRAAGAQFRMPPADEAPARLAAVLQAVYLVFTEGYAASSGDTLHRTDLTDEAIRMCRMLHATLPDDGEVAGLLALMLLTDARRGARTTADGGLVPLAEQDRALWDAAKIAEGIELVTGTLGRGRTGAYQVQAAIAAVHDEASTSGDTDWRQILALYGVLERIAPSPVVTLNQAVALAMVHGPLPALAMIGTIEHDPRMTGTHRLDAVRGHLLEMAGDDERARAAYLAAARMTRSLPEQRYLMARAAGLSPLVPPPEDGPSGTGDTATGHTRS